MPSYRTRRTLKPQAMDSARDVPGELLAEILTDATWAPTHGLTQPWRYDIFTGPARAKLGLALQKIYDATTPPAQRLDEKRAKLGQQPLLAPVVIAIAARVAPDGKISELDEICATACAVQNLLLSAADRGLGSFWSTPPATVSAEFAAWLGHRPTDRALGLLYLGWPKSGLPPLVSSRDPWERHTRFHRE